MRIRKIYNIGFITCYEVLANKRALKAKVFSNNFYRLFQYLVASAHVFKTLIGYLLLLRLLLRCIRY